MQHKYHLRGEINILRRKVITSKNYFPCLLLASGTNYRKRYYKGELPRKQTFENRVLSPEPKFVQKKRQLSDNKDTYKGVSTFEKEIPEKS